MGEHTQVYARTEPAETARYFLLLVEAGESTEVEQALLGSDVAFHVTRVENIAGALASLRKAHFDLALTDHQLPDGTSLDLLEALRRNERRIPPVIVHAVSGGEELAVSVMKAGAADFLSGDLDVQALPERLSEMIRGRSADRNRENRMTLEEAAKLLESIRVNLSRVNHDINNPLSIISGNAQLLLELAYAMDLQDDLVQPIRDIEEASRRIADLLHKLVVLRDRIPRPSSGGAPDLPGR